MNEVISIKLPSKAEYVSIARLTASVLANNIGFNFEEIEDIKVAVGEACNNAVLHGESHSDEIMINFGVFHDKFEVSVMDQGIGFDMNEYIEPDLENPKVGGLGIFIMKSLMDEVELDTHPQEGTCIKMTKFME